MNALIDRSAWTRRHAMPFLALLALNVAGFLLFTLPKTFLEERVVQKALLLRDTIAAQRQEIAALRRRTDAIKANIADTDRFYKIVQGCETGKMDVYQEILRLAREQNLTVMRRSPKEAQLEKVPLVEVGLGIGVPGTYPQLVGFLQKVEDSPQFLVIDKVQMREREEAGADLSVTLLGYCRAEATGGRRRRL